MRNVVAALVASLALTVGSLAATAPASAAGRDDGAHHARHTGRDDGPHHHRAAHR